MGYVQSIEAHYTAFWKAKCNPKQWKKGPMEKLYPDFRALEFEPTVNRTMWTYATCGMSTEMDDAPIELHIFSKKADENLVEILTAVAFYHKSGEKLDLHHTVNFGQPWQNSSKCEYGFISLPYLDGPGLENEDWGDKTIKFYWLIPITKQELKFKMDRGVYELERKFEVANFDYCLEAHSRFFTMSRRKIVYEF